MKSALFLEVVARIVSAAVSHQGLPWGGNSAGKDKQHQMVADAIALANRIFNECGRDEKL